MAEMMLSNKFYLTAEQQDRIDMKIQWFCRETGAILMILAELTGQLISEYGDEHLNASVLSALAASNLATTREIASLMGEPERFKSLFHEGKTRNFYLSEVANNLVLLTVFDSHTPIGLVSLDTQEAVENLDKIIAEARTNPPLELAAIPADLGESLAVRMDTSLG